jgi:glycerol dehydrogenase-like iron-containing ADH family enzyme
VTVRTHTHTLPFPLQEGSEHFVLYCLEARLHRPFIHGHIVGLGIYLMSRLQGSDPEVRCLSPCIASKLAFRAKVFQQVFSTP